jgi:hypothetical protein
MERTAQVKLSTKGLENVGSLGVKDLELVIGQERFECSRFEASFLSPRIAAALLDDATIEWYDLEIEVVSGDLVGECVNGLLSLARNGSFEVTERLFDQMKVPVIGKSLGNRELCDCLMEFTGTFGEVNMSNVLDRLSLSHFLDVASLSEIVHLASHFYGVDETILRRLDRDDLKAVLRSDQLRIRTEDSLLDFVLGYAGDSVDLFGCVRCDHLSVSGIARPLSAICFGDIDDNLWDSLCRRLRSFVQRSDIGQPRPVGTLFAFDVPSGRQRRRSGRSGRT